jgi:hypothetical protein
MAFEVLSHCYPDDAFTRTGNDGQTLLSALSVERAFSDSVTPADLSISESESPADPFVLENTPAEQESGSIAFEGSTHCDPDDAFTRTENDGQTLLSALSVERAFSDSVTPADLSISESESPADSSVPENTPVEQESGSIAFEASTHFYPDDELTRTENDGPTLLAALSVERPSSDSVSPVVSSVTESPV